MRRIWFAVLSACTAILFFTLPVSPARSAEVPGSATTIQGLVGQVTNSAPGIVPATSIQYGYLTYVRGVEHPFANGRQDESSALFTFFTSAKTTSVVTTGGYRTITRIGTTTIYFNSTPSASFTDANTFRAGTPIQTSTMQQQVVVYVSTGAFRTVNINSITAVSPISVDGRRIRLGTVGSFFTTFLVGQLHNPAPPSGYFSGYALDGRGTFATTSQSGVSAVPLLTPADGTGVSASFVVSFPSASVGDGMVLFGSGPGCSGLVEVASRDLFPDTTSHAVIVMGNDLPGSVGDNGIQPGTTYWYEVASAGPGGWKVDDNQGNCYAVTVPVM